MIGQSVQSFIWCQINSNKYTQPYEPYKQTITLPVIVYSQLDQSCHHFGSVFLGSSEALAARETGTFVKWILVSYVSWNFHYWILMLLITLAAEKVTSVLHMCETIISKVLECSFSSIWIAMKSQLVTYCPQYCACEGSYLFYIWSINLKRAFKI